ncbi:hypothetical protein VNO78_28908 [Psophocarpus tetragonolobus]|uniref:Transmembrane protein n=1 Tax=Psophocarpus tetragonolobus TaxID=3891 RepID=A0AAN9WZS6_PSOTE
MVDGSTVVNDIDAELPNLVEELFESLRLQFVLASKHDRLFFENVVVFVGSNFTVFVFFFIIFFIFVVIFYFFVFLSLKEHTKCRGRELEGEKGLKYVGKKKGSMTEERDWKSGGFYCCWKKCEKRLVIQTVITMVESNIRTIVVMYHSRAAPSMTVMPKTPLSVGLSSIFRLNYSPSLVSAMLLQL